MGLSYVSSLMITADIPFKLRPPHIRKTHNKMMSLYYGSFLCVITDDYSMLLKLRPLYIRRTHNNMMPPYGSFLCRALCLLTLLLRAVWIQFCIALLRSIISSYRGMHQYHCSSCCFVAVVSKVNLVHYS